MCFLDMIYKANICIIDPRTQKATRQECHLDLDYAPDYKDITIEFFRQWDNPDKYEICYAIGVESMTTDDSQN